MKYSILGYFIGEGFSNVFKNKKSTGASLMIMCATMIIFGIFLILGENINHFVDEVESEQGIQVFVKNEATQEQIDELGEKIRAIDGVNTVDFVSKDEALEQMKERFGERQDLLEGYEGENNIFTAYYVVTLTDLTKSKVVQDQISTYTDVVKKINSKPVFFHDKNEDGHYDVLSAFQKSIRGSDVNASLHYLARLIEAEDLDSIYRRMSVIAYEDIGLANPPAVDRCFNACQVAREVGLPEARIPLAFTVTDLTLSPKSKSAIKAVDEALESIDSLPLQVRNYLKLKGTHLSEEESYPYGEKDIWPHLKYLPSEIENKEFYHPETSGKYERALKENLEKLKKEKRFSKVSEARKYVKNGRKDSV